jgi:hypothetical protein
MVEFSYFHIKNEDLIKAYIVQAFVFLFFFLSYFLINKSNISNSKNLLLSNSFAFLILFWQVLFFAFNLYYGVNLAGVASSAPNKFLNYVFILIPADILFLLLSMHIKSDKLFYLNNLFYLISNLMRGWMSAPLIFILLLFVRFGVFKINLLRTFIVFTVFILLIFISPFLFELKWIARSNLDYIGVLENVFERGYLESLELTLNYIFSRFQHIYHVSLLSQRSDFFYSLYEANKILPYWSEGVVQNFIIKTMNISVSGTLGVVMAHEIFSSQDSWSANPGVSGWFFVMQENFILFYLYIFFLITVSFYFSKKYLGDKTFNLMAIFSVFYLLHGWVGAYTSFVCFMLILIFLSRVRLK